MHPSSITSLYWIGPFLARLSPFACHGNCIIIIKVVQDQYSPFDDLGVCAADISHVSTSHLFAISFFLSHPSRHIHPPQQSTHRCLGFVKAVALGSACRSTLLLHLQPITNKPRDITLLLRLIDTHNRFASSSSYPPCVPLLLFCCC